MGLKALRLLNEQVCEDKRGLFGWFRQKLKRRRIESIGHSISRHTAQEVDYLRSTLSNFPILCVLSKTKTLARFLHSLSLDFSFSLASIFLGIEGGKCRG